MGLALPGQFLRQRLPQWAALGLLVAIVLLCSIEGVVDASTSVGPPFPWDLHVGMGIYYQLQWDMPAAARNHFEEAWEQTGGDPEVAVAAAVAAYATGDFSSALQWTRLVSSGSAECPIALCLEGAIYLRQVAAAYMGGSGLRPDSFYASAERRFVEALALKSDLAFARHMLARVYAARGESHRALVLLREIPDAEQIDAVSDLIQALRFR